ncbi:response regulator [Sphingomonas xanthus]|uniref:Response regulator transcription factor n=1 Tax=Sphingomonas xanthus TaxID=2594473 RepID=A0A516ITM0_9SPHN|nr:response regulator transcription factor [Sphingomonas xanthus]QDP20246.1 response regulator transcription factor [Sphingomonas xanthus]
MNLLLADDHPMIRTAIEVLLRNSEFKLVGTETSGSAALASLALLSPDVLLLDLNMPGDGGMAVLRQIRGTKKEVRVILLTAAIEDSALIEAKRLGVDGIVLKNSDPAHLLECLEAVKIGRQWIDPELDERERQLEAGGRWRGRPQLAPRERQLITFVRKGLRNREIAEQLGVTEGTVKAYLHAVFDKLDVKNRTELAIRADEFLG